MEKLRFSDVLLLIIFGILFAIDLSWAYVKLFFAGKLFKKHVSNMEVNSYE